MEHYSDTLHKLSSSDPLTGVLNRRGTERALRRAFDTSRVSQSSIAVAILDLDHFKSINDRYGHGDGDIVLKTVAAAGASVVRGTDSFGRWGGEEFLAVLPSTDATGVELATERIKGAIDELKVELSSGASVTVSATIGVAVADPSVDGSTIDDLLRRADDALYRGKAAGRDRIVVAAATTGTGA